MVSSFKKFTTQLGSPALLFYALPYLMVILIIGTVSQKWLGLHEALETFFFSWIIWITALPLPGGLFVMSAITLNLTVKFLIKSKWSIQKAGINLIHFGILMLMIGGLGSLITRSDALMILEPQTQSAFTQSYTETDLIIFKNDIISQRIDFRDVALGNLDKLPFGLNIFERCETCTIVLRENDKQGWVGAFRSMRLIEGTAPINPEEHMQGISFEVSGLNDVQDGKYLTFESFPKPPEFTLGEDVYTVVIERHRTPLPFSLTLKDFQKDVYVGTNRAQGYTSTLEVYDGDLNFPAVITMNDPLRYRGYTFYQSSFAGDASVLAVVQNKAYIFPYIASLLVALGLIWHSILLVRIKK